MEQSLAWNLLQQQLQDAMQQLVKTQSIEAMQILQSHFQQLEHKANALMQSFPTFQGKPAYETTRWSLVAGALLCKVFLSLRQLRKKEGPLGTLREAFREDAVRLLHLRADHGRFFSKTLDEQIRQVEKVYIALRQREEARKAEDSDQRG